MTDPSLPDGWATVRLDQIAEVRLGRQRSPKNHSGEQMRPYLRAANVTWNGIDTADVKDMNFTDDEVETYRLRTGDILLSEASGSAKEVGKPGIWRGQMAGDVCFQNTLIRVRPEDEVDSDYLHLRFLHEALSGGFIESSRGVGIHHLGAAKLAALEIAVPPTSEQRRIVEELDLQLARFRNTGASLRAMLQMLKSLRHRVLLDAVNGVGRDTGSWTDFTLEQVLVSLKNGMFVSRPGAEPAGTAILRIGAVRALALDLNDRRWTGIPADDDTLTPYRIQDGDLLFTRYNGNPDFVGACAVVPELHEPMVYPDKLIRVRIDPAKAYAPFVAMTCAVGIGRDYIRSNVRTTAGQAGIAGRNLRGTPLRLPEIEEQRRIWDETKQTLDGLERVATAVNGLLRRAEAGSRAVLRLGVSGRLLPQDGLDEPADLLLKRIAEARHARVNAERDAKRTVPKARAPRASKNEETTA